MIFALFGVIFSANLWAHHMAAGIISDDLWDQIDESLVNTPHDEMLSISDPDMTIPDTVTTMSLDSESTDTIYLQSVVTVEFYESVPESEYELLVQELMDIYVVPASEEMNRSPAGTIVEYPVDTLNRSLYFMVKMVDRDADGTDDYAEIYSFEPIGKGNSQNIPTDTPSPPPGKRANGG
jgi:hypothetical protein